jgi:predicted PurR-regulated permease PerM
LQETCAYLRHRRTFAAKVVAAPRLREIFTVDFDSPSMIVAVVLFVIIVLCSLIAFMADAPQQSNRGPAPRKEDREERSAAVNPYRQYKTIIITAVITSLITAAITGVVPYIFSLFRGDIKTQTINEINQPRPPYF